MVKYLLCIIIGIILYLLLNNRNEFSVGCLHISASGSPAFNMFDFDDSDDDEPDPEPTPAPTPGELFKIGDIVEAHSLQGAPQHNGKIGTVEYDKKFIVLKKATPRAPVGRKPTTKKPTTKPGQRPSSSRGPTRPSSRPSPSAGNPRVRRIPNPPSR